MSRTLSAAIEVKDLVLGYRRHRHGDKVISEIPHGVLCSGEMVCLLGPNGAGKSTLLRTLCGLLPPLHGEISIDSVPLSQMKPSEMARHISIVLTGNNNLRGISVEDLVGLGRSPYTGFWGRLGDEDISIVQKSMYEVGISELSRRMIHTLSDGERQKVFIAKALAQESPIIILDEPTAFLDYPSKVEVMQMLRRLTRTKGLTVFLSTHDVEHALQTADRLWIMERSFPVSMGTPETLASEGVLERVFCHKGIEFNKETLQFKIHKDV